MCIHIFEEEFAEKLSDALAVGTDLSHSSRHTQVPVPATITVRI